MSSTVKVKFSKNMEKQFGDLASNVQFKTIEVLAKIYGFDVQDAVNKIGLKIKIPQRLNNKKKNKLNNTINTNKMAMNIKEHEQKYGANKDTIDKINIHDINIDDINIFNTTKKQDNRDDIDGRTLNDNNNGIRENIITAIINGNIPDYFYENNKQWLDLKNQIDKYINNLINKLYPNIVVLSKTIERKGGRKHKKDFILKLNKNDDYTISIEFKFNASNVSECPEFNSPSKPSKYFNISFEAWYYDNYLNKIAEKGNLNMPNRETYIKQINNNKPECMTEYKTLYKTDSEFNDFCGRIDKEAISEFINNVVKLDTEKLSSYLGCTFILVEKN